MVNAVRTLLANLDGSGFAPGDGEEYTPPDYHPVPLPGYLQTLRAVLFGTNPDRHTVLYRVRQFVALLHATALAQDVLAFDSRVTYLPIARGDFELPPSVAVLPIGGHTQVLIVDGPAPVQDGIGRTTFSWLITAN